MSPIVSEQYEFVIGVDTHAATHTFALVKAATGAVLGNAVFAASGAGLSRALDWLTRHASGGPARHSALGLSIPSRPSRSPGRRRNMFAPARAAARCAAIFAMIAARRFIGSPRNSPR